VWHLRDLRYFVVVADHGSFTRAARELFVTQPTLSKQIAVLERALRAPLFHRDHDGVRLTAAGAALLPHARSMIAAAGAAEAAVRAATTDITKLTVGFHIAPGNGLLTAAFADFSQRHPAVRTALLRVDWREPWAGVECGRVRVGLLWVPEGHQRRGLRRAVLLSEPMVLAMAPHHRLAGQAEVAPDDLRDEVILHAPVESMPETPKGMGRSFHVVRTIDETIETVAVGIGVIAVPPSLVAAHMAAHVPGEVITRPFREAYLAELIAVWRPEDDELPELRTMIRCLVRAAHVDAPDA
jgi:DNA-binding transcriptional LysR family regulator